MCNKLPTFNKIEFVPLLTIYTMYTERHLLRDEKQHVTFNRNQLLYALHLNSLRKFTYIGGVWIAIKLSQI